MKKRLISMLLALTMLLGILPVSALATDEPVCAKVTFTAQIEGEFLINPMFNEEIPSTMAEDFKYYDEVDPATAVSALDVLVYAHCMIFGEAFFEEPGDFLQVSNGWVTLAFGNSGGFGFWVNGQAANTGGHEYGDYSFEYMVNQAAVTDGDKVEFWIYQTTDWSDHYLSFWDMEGNKQTTFSFSTGEVQEFKIMGCSAFTGSLSDEYKLQKGLLYPMKNIELAILNPNGSKQPIAVTEDGYVRDLGLTTPGDYLLVAYAADGCEYKVIQGILPVKIYPEKEKVHVIVENTTYAVANGAAWEGTLVDTWVDIDEDSSIISCLQAVLKEGGYTLSGAEDGYVSEIAGLSATPPSTGGWMVALNDWFIHEGADTFTVAAGRLEPGDEVKVMYTNNGYGEDLGGSWNNNDKKVADVQFNVGKLLQPFDKDAEEPVFQLLLPYGTTEVLVTPTASNKNFQVRTYHWSIESDEPVEYKRNEMIPVQEGDLLEIICGDPDWPSMNNGEYGSDAEKVDPCWYLFEVVMGPQYPDLFFNVDLSGLKDLPGQTITGGVDCRRDEYDTPYVDVNVPEGEETVLSLSSWDYDQYIFFMDFYASSDIIGWNVNGTNYFAEKPEDGENVDWLLDNDVVVGYSFYDENNNGQYYDEEDFIEFYLQLGNEGAYHTPGNWNITPIVLTDAVLEAFDAIWAIQVKLDEVGEITLDFGDMIQEATELYDALSDMDKDIIAYWELTEVLESAQAAYDALKADQDAADEVMELIGAIGTVTLQKENAIVAARNAYNRLNDTRKALVTNLSVLTDAESTLAQLKEEAAVTEVVGLIDAIGEVTLEKGNAVNAAREAFDALDETLQTGVTNYDTLLAAEQRLAYLQAEERKAKLQSLIVHTSYSPSDANVLIKNAADSYTNGITFDPNTLTYNLTVASDSINQLRFQAQPPSGGTVTLYYGDGESKDITWSSGSSKWANCLTAGRNELQLVVAAEGKETITYTLIVDVYPSLTDLAVDSDAGVVYWNQTFASGQYAYTLTVPANTQTLTLTAVPRAEDAVVTFNGGASNVVNIENCSTVEIELTKGGVTRSYTITLVKAPANTVTFAVGPENAVIQVYDYLHNAIAPNADGSYTGMFASLEYTYTISKYGYVAATGTVPAEGGVITVELAKAADSTHGDVDAYWPNFRGNSYNQAITNALTPIDPEKTELKWNKLGGSGWSDAPSVQIIADNALITLINTGIYKLDLTTGKVLAQGTMVAKSSYGYIAPVYAEGMIICALNGGYVQAFDAETLESVWIYHDPRGGQDWVSVIYSDGYVYTGFWNSDVAEANFVCLSVTDEDPTKTDEAKLATWTHSQPGGFYWAGAAVVGDAVIIGTDDGTKDDTGTAYVYSFNKYNGEVISKLALTGMGDQRSSMAYDATSSRVYFTTKGGYLCSAQVNAETGVLSDLKQYNHGLQSTSTPVIYKGKVYYGTGAGFGSGYLTVADAETLETLYQVEMQGYPQASVLLSTGYEKSTGYIYIYLTYNNSPGGISMIKIDPTKDTADGAELIELYDAEGFNQYCICSIICGPDGTLYYKNDSLNVLAVASPAENAVMVLIDAIGETVTLDSEEVITIARNAYVALTEDEKAKVTNYAELTAAENKLAQLKQDVTNKAAADAVIAKINEIGIVTLESKEAIKAARIAYDALTDAQKALVTNYEALNAAEASLKALQDAADKAASDKAAADATAEKISAIGTVTLESKTAVEAARAAYDALTAEQKALVTNYETLTAAETKLAELKTAAEKETADKAAADAVTEKIAAIGTVTNDSKAAIETARAAYDALTPDQKALVANYSTLTAAEKAFSDLKQPAEPSTPTEPSEPANPEKPQTKVEITEGGITTVPESLKQAGLDTPEEVKQEMVEAIIEKNKETDQKNVAHYDVALMYSEDGGKTWIKADETHFPANGKITVTIPYPAGTDSTYDFTVVHMFTSNAFGKTPGDVEMPKVTKTKDGIQFEVTGLSPISVGWTAPKTSDSPQTGDDTNIALYASLVLVCVAGLAVVLYFDRKRKYACKCGK